MPTRVHSPYGDYDQFHQVSTDDGLTWVDIKEDDPRLVGGPTDGRLYRVIGRAIPEITVALPSPRCEGSWRDRPPLL